MSTSTEEYQNIQCRTICNFLSHDFLSIIKQKNYSYRVVQISASIHEGTMGELLKTVVIKILKVLPLICIALLSSSIVMLAVSLNPGVKWNEYTTDVWGLPTYYFSTLHSSLDVAMYAGVKNGKPCDSEYLALLNPHHDGKFISFRQNT